MKRLLVAAAFLPALAYAGDFMDVRLTFTATDENVLVKPGETTPSIPGPRIGAPLARWGTLFFDNLDTRYSGFENLSNLVFYRRAKDEEKGREVEGAFVLRFYSFSDVSTSLSDGGSYIKFTKYLTPGTHTNFSLTAFPLSSDRMRLGYTYKISYAGSPIFFKLNPDNPNTGQVAQNNSPVPGAKMQLAGDGWYSYVGIKGSVLLNKSINEQASVGGALLGAGYDVSDMLRLETNGGYFYRGANPKQAVLGQPLHFNGVSALLTMHDGITPKTSSDYALYQNDPTSLQQLFVPEKYPGGLSWLSSLEGTYLRQTLEDPDAPQSTVAQSALAGDLKVRVKYDYWRLRGDVMYRDLAFVLNNVPSFVPFMTFGKSAQVTPDYLLALGVDRYFPNNRITVGVTGGVERPATFRGTLPPELAGNNPADTLPLSSTVVVQQEGLFNILPPKQDTLLVYAGKVQAKVDFADYFSLVGECLVGYNPNEAHLQRDDPEAPYTRVFANPWQLGFNLSLGAKL